MFSDDFDDFDIDLDDFEETISDSAKGAVTGANDLEQPVVEVPDVSEQPETKFSDEVSNELKSSLDALSKNLANTENSGYSKGEIDLSEWLLKDK